MAKVKGEFYRLYLNITDPLVADTLVGCATEVSISFSVTEVEEPQCAEDFTPGTAGTWVKSTPGDKSFTIDVSGLVIPTNAANIQQFFDSIDAGTIHLFSLELLDDVAPNPNPTILKTYAGQAWISAHDNTGANEEFATYSLTLTGYDQPTLT